MKNQWFGDINDYYKYGFLRFITRYTGLRIGICWMLTKNDGRNPNTGYLTRPEIWRHYDPNLYDFLKHHVIDCNVRDIVQIENQQILPACQFHSEILEDEPEARQQYFNSLKRLVRSCDLLFFDADNGMEVKSKPYGRKHSSKYLYWHEAKQLYDLGCSPLIFQYHRRVKYADFVESLSNEFKANIGVEPQSFYRTKHVTLLLLAQSRHQTIFQELNKTLEACWQKEIQVVLNPKALSEFRRGDE